MQKIGVQANYGKAPAALSLSTYFLNAYLKIEIVRCIRSIVW